MKYNVGDRVLVKSLDWYNKNKDEDGNIDINHDFTFYADRSRYCGKVFTIVEVFDNCYAVKEDNNEYYWSDEMIEGLVEAKTKPKFKEGDRITNGTVTLTILTISSDRYIVEDNLGGCGTLYFNTRDDWKIVEDENNRLTETVVDYVKESNDRYRIVIDPRFDIEVDEGEYYAVRRKKEYPKTFLGCCDVLGIEDLISRGVKGYKAELFDTLQKLYICRDAYWKIAGEEMGLGKPWEPDWTYNGATKYCIGVSENEIQNFSSGVAQYTLAFPTEEMRDTFKENFDPDIKICKEFL